MPTSPEDGVFDPFAEERRHYQAEENYRPNPMAGLPLLFESKPKFRLYKEPKPFKKPEIRTEPMPGECAACWCAAPEDSYLCGNCAKEMNGHILWQHILDKHGGSAEVARKAIGLDNLLSHPPKPQPTGKKFPWWLFKKKIDDEDEEDEKEGEETE